MPPTVQPPAASIIIPCYNEVRTIGALLQAIAAQSVRDLEVIIADGGSDDGTRQAIQDFAEDHPDLNMCIVDNPTRSIPAALNVATAKASGAVVIRLDAHSAPRPDYVERCLETLERTQAANAGGLWEIHPGADTWVARGIAAAAAHPLGAGDARYRIDGAEGPVDTVPFGAYRRDWMVRVGRFNEGLLTNEDYEYNVRIRRAGGTVWFNPAIRSTYQARADLRGLARQYARYGFWKARMLLSYPRSLRWRQALPPLFLLTTLVLALAASILPSAGTGLALLWEAYLAILFVAGLRESLRRRQITLALSFPLAIATIHLAWGGAFWLGLGSAVLGGGAGRAK